MCRLARNVLFVSAMTILISAVVGCGGSTLKIVRAKTPQAPASDAGDAVPGMPFYLKSAACKHQSVWLQPVYTLNLVIKVDATIPVPPKPPEQPKPSTKVDSKTYAFAKTLSLQQFADKHVEQLRALLSTIKGEPQDTGTAQTQLNEIKTLWEAIRGDTYDPFKYSDEQTVRSGDVILAANTVAPELYVDYNTTYYLNSSKPIAGSSQASFKIAGDGTLSEGAAQQESKTLQTFLDLVPFKDVITKLATGALGLAFDGGALPYTPPNAQKATYDFSLKVDVKTYKRTHTAYEMRDQKLIAPPCAFTAATVEKPAYSAYNYMIQDAAADMGNSADKSTIKVNGTVMLPTSEDAAKKN